MRNHNYVFNAKVCLFVRVYDAAFLKHTLIVFGGAENINWAMSSHLGIIGASGFEGFFCICIYTFTDV